MINVITFLSLKNERVLTNDPQILKYPILTDKTTKLLESNKYSFKVDSDANKTSIKRVIESLFCVTVLKVNTCHLPKKKKRVGKYIGWKPKYKKAIVTLSEDNIINLFDDN